MKLTLDTLPMYCEDCGGCLRWKLGVNSRGYPQACLGGKPGQMVRRYVYTVLMGKQITPGCVVTTRCDDPMCVSPDHLISKRRGLIQAHSYATGRRMTAAEYGQRLRSFQQQGRTKLDWPRVAEIRSRPPEMSHAEIAREFGVHQKTISKVRRGESWREQIGASSVFAWRPA